MVLRSDMKVSLVDYMGSDHDIANAARVSVQSSLTRDESPRRLIRYLMRHRHTSPFEMVETKWRIQCPIFVARQMLRHRTASVNEISGRYSELPDDQFLPELSRLQHQDPYNKQQSALTPLAYEEADQILDYMSANYDDSRADYETFLAQGLARETARIVLPMAQYTEFIWKINLHNLFHFLKLRLGNDAQAEIQNIARQMLYQVRSVAPEAVQAWEEYVLNAITFTGSELSALLCSSTLDEILKSFEGCKSELKEFGDKLASATGLC